MSTRIFLALRTGGPRLECKLPHPEAAYVDVPGLPLCPYCAAPLGVAGSGQRPSDDDQAWEADAGCTACKAHLGLLRVEVNTLFGVREDRAVLQGRCRVYLRIRLRNGRMGCKLSLRLPVGSPALRKRNPPS